MIGGMLSKVLGGISVVLLLALLAAGWKITALQRDIAVEKATVAELRGAIETQNNAVNALEAQGKEAIARFDFAMQSADAVNKRSNGTIGKLLAAKGESCDDVDGLLKKYRSGGFQ